MKITLPAIFSSASTKVDGSVKMTFESRELGKDAAELFAMAHKEGWLLFSPNELKEADLADIPDEKADSMTASKTRAQRLRATLFVFWKQRGSKGEFESFYNAHMEKLIEHIKDKLE